MSIALSRLRGIPRGLVAAIAIALGLASGVAKAQPQAPPLETYLLTEERLVRYILTAVDMAAEQFALLERYGVPMFAPDPMAALLAAGAGAEAAALLARYASPMGRNWRPSNRRYSRPRPLSSTRNTGR